MEEALPDPEDDGGGPEIPDIFSTVERELLFSP